MIPQISNFFKSRKCDTESEDLLTSFWAIPKCSFDSKELRISVKTDSLTQVVKKLERKANLPLLKMLLRDK